ncbi:MAG TPA: UDP-glucose 4-epimerase GalE [Limnobacter sp.]|nr:UDP-glucose 4-epimerase GalE [Limnobacter sp.]
MSKKVLVVGGAGYIGSHMVKLLLGKQCSVVTLDNLSSGHRDAVLGGQFVHGDIADTALLGRLFAEHRFDAVMHFASYIQVGESVLKPAMYYQNNVANTLNLLQAMAVHKVPHFVFSSTAATFGEPQAIPMDERHPQVPINPYGKTKWMIEQALPDFEKAYGLTSVCLRYFNAAGAHPEGLLGERHDPETHLIPLVLQAASGKREHISVFGTDYPTPDGTCIRDYIHVMDLCEAHWLALEHLWKGLPSQNFNLGNGTGFSVQEVINTARAVTGLPIEVKYAPRRAGDPASLVADSTQARSVLGWRPQYANLSTIVEHAWRWECAQSK